MTNFCTFQYSYQQKLRKKNLYKKIFSENLKLLTKKKCFIHKKNV